LLSSDILNKLFPSGPTLASISESLTQTQPTVKNIQEATKTTQGVLSEIKNIFSESDKTNQIITKEMVKVAFYLKELNSRVKRLVDIPEEDRIVIDGVEISTKEGQIGKMI
jgi:D-serine dehydratase